MSPTLTDVKRCRSSAAIGPSRTIYSSSERVSPAPQPLITKYHNHMYLMYQVQNQMYTTSTSIRGILTWTDSGTLCESARDDFLRIHMDEDMHPCLIRIRIQDSGFRSSQFASQRQPIDKSSPIIPLPFPSRHAKLMQIILLLSFPLVTSPALLG